MSASLISIDFDFLVRHGMHKEITLGNGDVWPGMFVYDWQMSESRHPELENALWEIRAANFKQWGLDIQEMMAPELSVSDFATEISIHCGDAHFPWWKSDSHGWAGLVARDYAQAWGGPLSVVNFDAHHDLGYRNIDEKLPVLDFEKLACDNWAAIGMHEGWIRNYTVVYPDWLGRWEWGERISRPWLKSMRNRIHITTWSEWLASGKEIRNPVAGFMCRSSSWVPPWFDGEFQSLVDEFGADCLDCGFGQAGSPYDVCKAREWDWAVVDERVRMIEELKARKDLTV